VLCTTSLIHVVLGFSEIVEKCQVPFHPTQGLHILLNPVCRRNFHHSKTTSDLLEDLMITYGNGEYFICSMYQRLNLVYLGRISTYYNQNKCGKCKNVITFPHLNEWIGQYYLDGAKKGNYMKKRINQSLVVLAYWN
jgi:hypothetical protein